jgi:hypothetical protein
MLAMSICFTSAAFTGELTGLEKVVASTMTIVMKRTDGKYIGMPRVRRENTTLRECYERERYGMNDFYTATLAKQSAGSEAFESISVNCIYELNGNWEEYFVGFWSSEGRYEPVYPHPSMHGPEWEK